MNNDGKCKDGPWDGKALKSEHNRVQLSRQNAMTSLTPPQATGDPLYVVHSFFGEYRWQPAADPDFSRMAGHWQWHGDDA